MIDPLHRNPALFESLQQHYQTLSRQHLNDLFGNDPARFSTMSVEAAGLFMDYSKNRIIGETLKLLFDLARKCDVESRRDAMLAGETINRTERRAVLHTALRAPADIAVQVDNENIIPEVHAVLDQMRGFVERVRSGEWRGFTGAAITDVVNIGIGGSDLGPKMACHALRPWCKDGFRMHFVSNVDGHDIDACLSKIRPETTLFVIASKTFTTQETMMNARTARDWFLQKASEADLPAHFVAVSTNTEAVSQFGINPDNMFPFWDWVGGRYSVWSAIGLPIALAVGFDRFTEFLAGARHMDEHFLHAPLEANMPVIHALIGIWNRNFFKMGSLTIAPYHQDLCHFPAYLQQLEMESNGKRVMMDGTPVSVETCPVIWGAVGTNGQHAYFQMLHQGTDIIPVDFIAALKPSHDLPGHHAALLANCFAQAEAFMKGKTADEARAELQHLDFSEVEREMLVSHKTFPGNRPSNMILMDKLTPASLGALIALYEHKVFVQGIIWGLNSFDQWGVELGKVLAKTIHHELVDAPSPEKHDASTNGLIARARAHL
jgi:glucose-6-phosphate isomerase